MPEDEPKWRRRKQARPAEIVDAALEVFAEKGFAAAKLDDISAQRPGSQRRRSTCISTLRKRSSAPLRNRRSRRSFEALESQSEATDAPFAELAPKLLLRAGCDDEGRPWCRRLPGW